MYLLDTNVISETRRPGRMHHNVRAWLEQVIKPAFNGRILPIDEATAGISPACTSPTAPLKTIHG